MWTSVELLRLLAVSHLLAFTALLLRDHARNRTAVATAGFILASICHLLRPVLEAHVGGSWLVHVAVLGDWAAPASFWVLTRVHFDDGHLRAWHWAALAFFVASGYVSWHINHVPALATWPPVAANTMVWVLAPQLLTLVIVGYAVACIYSGSRVDLVSSRLRLRYWILGAAGAYVVVERLILTLTNGTAGEAAVEWLYAVSVAVFVVGVLVASTLVQPGLLMPGRATAPPDSPPDPSPDPHLANHLRRLMEVDHVYRQEGLTITALAARLGVHEFKVRQIINTQIGFKNFNAFLHHYRLAEAQRLLADPGKRSNTVAQVAFEVGYASLGPFNRAFKEATGLTPTEFRMARAVVQSVGSGEGAPAAQTAPDETHTGA